MARSRGPTAAGLPVLVNMVRRHHLCSTVTADLFSVPACHRVVRGSWNNGFGDGVQTTLLGLAIAIILALTAALVGPHFVDWNRYRAEFEANASALIGLEVRAKGAIELRLLPTPALMLGQFEVSRPGD